MHLERAYCVWSILWLYSGAFLVFYMNGSSNGRGNVRLYIGHTVYELITSCQSRDKSSVIQAN